MPSMMNDTQQELPAELLAQLSKNRTPPQKIMERDELIRQLLQDNGPMDKDQLLVGIWKETKIILKRPALSAHLGSMVNKGTLRRAGRGVFAIKEEAGEHTTH